LPGGRLIARILPSRAAIVAREIRHLPFKREGRLLDVGCGNGDFVRQMAALGWDAEGLDPDPSAVTAGGRSGVKITQGTLADLDLDLHAGVFDAITLSHVIEHVHDPAGDLRRIRSLLSSGGLVWIATPNLEALGLRRFGRDWVNLDPPRHLVLFTRASLERIVRDAGLEPLPVPRASPLARHIYSQSAAIAEDRLPYAGSAGGTLKMRMLAAVANRAAYRDPRHADELVMIGRRP
jgi:SAM-dependent methyltransferase